MLMLCVLVLTIGLIAALAARTPSTYLFDLIEGCFYHGFPARRG